MGRFLVFSIPTTKPSIRLRHVTCQKTKLFKDISTRPLIFTRESERPVVRRVHNLLRSNFPYKELITPLSELLGNYFKFTRVQREKHSLSTSIRHTFPANGCADFSDQEDDTYECICRYQLLSLKITLFLVSLFVLTITILLLTRFF
jgi:hypothetical protein